MGIFDLFWFWSKSWFADFDENLHFSMLIKIDFHQNQSAMAKAQNRKSGEPWPAPPSGQPHFWPKSGKSTIWCIPSPLLTFGVKSSKPPISPT
jgi:hypothetical protein